LIWQHWRASHKPEIPSQILSLEITPSQKSEQGIIYKEGAKAIVVGKNLAKVEFYQRGGGTEIYTSPEGGLIAAGAKLEAEYGKEIWESPSLPVGKSMIEFCAIGFNEKGTKGGEVCLSHVFGQTQEETQQEAQKLQNKILLDNCIADAQQQYDDAVNNYFDSCIASTDNSDNALEACTQWADQKGQEISQRYENLKNACYKKYPDAK